MSPNVGFNAETRQDDNWRTPAWLFKALDTEFLFDVDGAADESNKLCPIFVSDINHCDFITYGSRVFCNPPYSNIAPFVNRSLTQTGLWVFALPVRTRSDWFELLVNSGRAELRWFRKRIAFDPPPGVEASSPRMNTFIAVVR